MSGPYTIAVFDNSCHLYYSFNSGVTWFETSTYLPTVADDWTDMIMAVNDGDYDSLVIVDLSNGIEIGALSNAPALETTIPIVPRLSQNSGAMTAQAKTILITNPPPSATGFPVLTTNTGVTWSSVTGLPSSTYAVAAFSKNAAVMYIHRYNVGLYKSTDGGVTWTHLTASPAFTGTGGGENQLRLRCSQDGTVIGIIDFHCNFYVSTDGGATFTYTNFSSMAGGSSNFGADFGMSTDGTHFVVAGSFSIPAVVAAWVSTNGGTSFSSVTPPSTAISLGVYNVNMAPDHLGIVIAYQYQTNIGTALYDLSFDGGATWRTATPPLNQLTGGDTGLWVAAWILPPSAPPPPSTPVPFPGNPQTPTSPTGVPGVPVSPGSPLVTQPIPALYMRYSNDGGHTWSNYRPKGLV